MKDYSSFTLKTLTFDTVPDTFQLSFIVPRAKFFLLGDRTEKELDDIGLTLLLAIELYKEDGDRDDLRSLFRIAKDVQHDFSAWVAAPGWSWEEGFALFALLKVAEALRHLEREPLIAAECALEAMEAVCFADLLESRKETKDDRAKDPARHFQTQLASHDSARARKAANARHDKTTRPIKTKAIELYESKKWRSDSEAARFIYQELKKFIEKEGIQFRLSVERGPKTICDWIRAHRRKTTNKNS